MERLNWAVLGLIGIVTALGLGTSSGAGKTKSDEQPVSVAASSNAPGCDACRIAQAEATTKVTVTPIKTDDACSGNCAATGACCDKSMSSKDGVVSITRSGEVYDVIVPADKKPDSNIWIDVPSGVAIKKPSGPIQDLDKPVCEGDCPLSNKSSVNVTSTDCPLTKAADAIANLTKQYVCEGGECLNGKPLGTLTITAVEPASTQPEGLSNLLAAAEAVEASQPAPASSGSSGSTIILNSEDLTKAGAGTLTLSVKAADDKPAVAIVAETKPVDAKPAIDNSRAATRAAKLAKLEAKLEEPSQLELNQDKLFDIVDLLSKKYGIPVTLDWKAFEEAAFDTATPIDCEKQSEIALGDHLQSVLKRHSLTWLIPATNDRVLITTTTAAENTHLNRVYDVSDLVGSGFSEADELIDRITGLVAPITWKTNGGRGDITAWQQNSDAAIIVSNTYETHRELTSLLEDLRFTNVSKQKGAHAKRLSDNKESELRSYALPPFNPDVTVENRAKILKGHGETLLSIFKEIPQFDPASFQVIELNHQPMILTKQQAKVHAQIVEYFKILQWDPRKHGGLTGANF